MTYFEGRENRMENETRWIATWTDHMGQSREYLFYSVESRVIARVDFQLRLMDQGEPVPNEFELEEATTVLPRVIGERKQV
jgi:hypothetical protein